MRIHPLLHSERARMLAPFGAAVALGLVMIALPPTPSSWLLIEIAVGVTLALFVVAFLAPWRRLPAWAPSSLPLLYFGVILLLRDAQGGASSGYAPLCMLPVFWLSLYGTRRQLGIAIAAVATIFIGPLLVIGGSAYPTSEWRRGILWAAIAGLVGFRVQALVANVKERGRKARVQAEVLQQTEAQMADAIAHSPMGVAQTALDGTFLSVNPALCLYLARAEEDLLGRRARDLSHPDDRDATTAAADRLARGEGVSHHEEKRYLQPDGTEVWMVVSITVVRDEDGEPSHLLSYFADITAQKGAERALRESEASLTAIARVTRTLSSSVDVRTVICEATVEVADAAATYMFEPEGDELVLTAGAGIELPTARISLRPGTESSGAAGAYLSGRGLFVENAKTNPAVSKRIAEQVDAGSVLYEPILSHGKSIGVLVVMWRRKLEKLSDAAVVALGLLADEAAVALERAALFARLNEQAFEDELTSLPNRRAWEERLPVEVARAAREKTRCSIALIDLDRFKLYNDTHGHPAGDHFLAAAALAWRGGLRPTDFLARYGGEEFAIILPGCDIPEALIALDRLAACVPDGQTCSIGVASWDGYEHPHALVERADRNLYKAKQDGRARIEAGVSALAAAATL